MKSHAEHIQLVWDRESAATAQGGAGCSIHVGPGCEWSPEQLLVAAAESSLMTSFLRLAAEQGLDVLGYVSAAEQEPERPDATPRIVIRPCVVVRSEADRAQALAMLASAGVISSIARLLRSVVRVEAQVVVVPPASAAPA